MMPAAMNSEALKVAWLRMWKIAATMRQRSADAEQHRDQPEVADRRIGQQTLQVVLEDRDEGADQHGAHAPAPPMIQNHSGVPAAPATAHEQKHAGLHHGRRMQVGRHRRRRRHRVRQPEMEGELRALGERAERNQHQGREVEGWLRILSPAASTASRS
jgi:hypothetical protein